MSSTQTTLDGDEVDIEREKKRHGGVRSGTPVILLHAPKDTEWERVANWVARARAEGVIEGVDP